MFRENDYFECPLYLLFTVCGCFDNCSSYCLNELLSFLTYKKIHEIRVRASLASKC
jgi:hypothetical protein